MCIVECHLSEIAEHLQADLLGDPEIKITGLDSIKSAKPGDITFFADSRLREYLLNTQASAIILKKEDCPQDVPRAAGQAFLIAANPHLAFARVAELFLPRHKQKPEIDASASVHHSCNLGREVSIGPGVCIAEGVTIGDHCEIAPNCVIGAHTSLGCHCRLEANVSIAERTQIGKNVIIHAGAAIGYDGFGLTKDEQNHWVKIPQCGRVLIGDDSEIGCNTTIDRGAFEDTVIGEDVRIDNLVHIGHNVSLGAHTAIAGGTLIAGSAKIGEHCLIGGASRINGHLEIVDHVSLAATSMVLNSIKVPGRYKKFTFMFQLLSKCKQLQTKLIRLKKQQFDRP